MTTHERNCIHCRAYVDCKTRVNGMRKVKKNHGTNRREDIRTRIAAMAKLAEGCGKWKGDE